MLQKSQCQSGGIHPPSKESMKEFVKVARRRMKYISVCGGAAAGGGMPQDIAAEVSNIIKVSLKICYMFSKNIMPTVNFICFSIFYRFYR